MVMGTLNVPLFAFPIVSVIGAPVVAFVILKVVEMFGRVQEFARAWIVLTYVLLVIQAIGLSVMLARLVPS